MKEENKKSKKKILLTYLILAACLLVIAAITVTVIFTVNRNPNDNIIDNNRPDDGNQGGNNGGNQGGNNGDNDDNQDDKSTISPDSYILPVETASITTRYDFVHDVTLDRYKVHTGMDFEGKAGTEVCAVQDGTVIDIVTDHIIGENYVTVSHANGVTSTYKYIEAKEGLKKGDSVKRGDVLGKIAPAAGVEMKQGDHLHFEMSVNGKPADPDVYLDISEK